MAAPREPCATDIFIAFITGMPAHTETMPHHATLRWRPQRAVLRAPAMPRVSSRHAHAPGPLRRLLPVAALALWMFCVVQPVPATALTLLTEDLPPFNYLRNGMVCGPGADIVSQVLARNGLPVRSEDIRVLPWARALHLAQTTPDALLFSTARTPEREALFKWVGPIMRVTVGTVTRKGDRRAPRRWDDLRDLRIGTVRNTVGEQLLLQKGIAPHSLHAATTPADAVRMLTAGRVDVLAFNIHSTFYVMEQAAIESTQYGVSMVLDRFDLYMAFNPAVDDMLLQRLQSTLDAMRCNGGSPGSSDFSRIVQPYSPYFPPGSFPEERNCPRSDAGLR